MAVEKEGRKRTKLSAVSAKEATNMYLILLSYAEKHKAAINKLIVK